MRTELRKPAHRPLTPEELEAQAANLDRVGRQELQIGIEVTAPNAPEPKLDVRRDADGWRVELTIPGASVNRQLGGTATTMPRPGRAGPVPRQLDGFVPEHAPVRVKPETEPIEAQRMRLRGRPNREYDPLVVFPGDARHLLTDRRWPWNLTGLVTTSDGKSGSGVLVGDRLMLTAHHLRPGKSISRGSWWMTFTPNFDSGNNPIAPFGSSYISDLRHYDAESDNEYVVGHDFMLCRLKQPLGRKLGYVGATSFDDAWRGQKVWHNIGYPVDVGGGTRPAVQTKQSMEDDYEDDNGQIIETEASLNNGNSGGPFFAWFTDGQVRLCSVVSGGAGFGGDRDNALAGGDDMVHLIAWGRTNWPA